MRKTVYTDIWILFIQICGYCLYRYVDTVYTYMYIVLQDDLDVCCALVDMSCTI